MATRKKSLNDIRTQLMRIQKSAYQSDNLDRLKQAKKIADAYAKNITKTKSYESDRQKALAMRSTERYPQLVQGAFNRKYVDYNTDTTNGASIANS